MSFSQHALLPVTQRMTEHAAVKSALMGDGDGRDDGTRTSDCRRVGGEGGDAHREDSDMLCIWQQRFRNVGRGGGGGGETQYL